MGSSFCPLPRSGSTSSYIGAADDQHQPLEGENRATKEFTGVNRT